MQQFVNALGTRHSTRIRLTVMDMGKPFRYATNTAAPQAAILFDKVHIMRHLGEALDQVRKSESARLQGHDRRFSKGQKSTLRSRRENLRSDDRQSLKTVRSANKRLNTAYLRKEAFGQVWSDEREGWARRFFEHWNDALKGQRRRGYWSDVVSRLGLEPRTPALKRGAHALCD
jgi:transposase